MDHYKAELGSHGRMVRQKSLAEGTVAHSPFVTPKLSLFCIARSALVSLISACLSFGDPFL